MNYKRIYNNFMKSRLKLKKVRIEEKRSGLYFECHHIIPKSMGGEGRLKSYKDLEHKNIVVLTAREHYIAHALLWKIHRNREMAMAFHAMCSFSKTVGKKRVKQKHIVSSRLYNEVRTALNKMGVSDEVKERLRRANLGKKMSPEAIEKIRRARLGRRMSEESKEKLRVYRTGRKMPPDAIERSRLANMDPEVIARKNATRLRNKMLKEQALKNELQKNIRKSNGVSSSSKRRKN